MQSSTLFDPIRPFQTLRIDVGGGHQLHVEISGNPEGLPIVMLHGGPGSGLNPDHRRLFDPAKFMLIQFDQRGCGQSTPHGATAENTTQHLVRDIDTIRSQLAIQTWHIAGGSWGSTLALAYARTFTRQVRSLTLYGIFLGRQKELEALYFKGGIASRLFPELFADFLKLLPEKDTANPIEGYAKLFASQPSAQRTQALLQWTQLEKQCSRLVVEQHELAADLTNEPYILAHSLIENHYFRHNCFIDGDALLASAGRFLADIPVTLINGRYDIVTPPETAYELTKAIPHAHLMIVEGAGHSVKEPSLNKAFIQALDSLA